MVPSTSQYLRLDSWPPTCEVGLARSLFHSPPMISKSRQAKALSQSWPLPTLELMSVHESFFGAEGVPSPPRTLPAALSSFRACLQQALPLLLILLVGKQIPQPLFECFKRIQGLREVVQSLVRALHLHFTPNFNFGIVARRKIRET